MVSVKGNRRKRGRKEDHFDSVISLVRLQVSLQVLCLTVTVGYGANIFDVNLILINQGCIVSVLYGVFWTLFFCFFTSKFELLLGYARLMMFF